MLLDPEHPLRHLIVVNKGGSGININNIAAIFIGTVRDAAWSREHIPNQNFGRGLRINTGVGNLAQTKYLNNLENYSLLENNKEIFSWGDISSGGDMLDNNTTDILYVYIEIRYFYINISYFDIDMLYLYINYNLFI